MKLITFQQNFNKKLLLLYPQTEVDTFFQWLCEAYLGYTRFDISVYKEKELAFEKITLFDDALARLQNFEPIQYILGATEFYGLQFLLNKHTLIPRPETEELVNWILEDVSNIQKSSAVLDIGTGSGCIAISLAKNLSNTSISAIDISAQALQVAIKNASVNDVVVAFIKQDILASQTLPSQYDIIVSNPPYVRNLEKEYMQANVLQHEPENALFVSNENPLLFYKKIAQLATKYLTNEGLLYFEINEYLEAEMRQMLQSLYFKNIETKKDIFGKNRMMRCQL